MGGFKVRLPKVAALEMGPEGLFNRIEYVCGCKTVRTTLKGGHAVWTFLERCDTHGKGRPSVAILVDPKPPDWWGP